ncbi:DUF305 domain-containing protein [Thioalkalivibrio denitrificans]|uniref:DUF305 domain-containing protein n=1 Tax=Thioalkalivibrio denitrificans TaxID=108003 RepID=A0A1V3NG34_9GAMM|nr:DUF305 domain-containing protein [Thioalkalivibrio denitrificans]OOG23883.1 DUF305 domain-containing protein [Thioalkalivibrio denitrificans]
MLSQVRRSLPLLLILCAPVALAQQGHEHHGHDHHHGAADADEPPSVQAYREVNDRMHHDMNIAFTGDADVDFVRGMIPHHEGAVGMAEVVLEYGEDPEIRKLAKEIIEAQKEEIEMMRRWLAERGHD